MSEDMEISSPPSAADGGGKLFAWLTRIRNEQPVFQDANGVWNVFRYADVERIISDHTVFSSDPTPVLPHIAEQARGNLLALDPPAHHTLRKLVGRVFTPKAVAAWEPRIQQIGATLFNDLDGLSELDLVEKLTDQLPIIVIAELLGVPVSDRQLFSDWASRMLSAEVVGPADPKAMEEALQATAEMNAYLSEHCLARRARPTDDLIGKLVAAEVDGDRLDDDEVVNFSRLLLSAGHITTTMLLGNTVLCFDEYPDMARQVRNDRTLIPMAIEEALRYRPPFLVSGRFTAADTKVGGVRIPARSIVMPWLLSAHRDERQFSDPDTFQLGRDTSSHLAFGKGIHFCLGAPLGRLEGRVTLDLMFDRFADIAVIPEGLEYYAKNFFGVKTLPIAVRSAH